MQSNTRLFPRRDVETHLSLRQYEPRLLPNFELKSSSSTTSTEHEWVGSTGYRGLLYLWRCGENRPRGPRGLGIRRGGGDSGSISFRGFGRCHGGRGVWNECTGTSSTDYFIWGSSNGSCDRHGWVWNGSSFFDSCSNLFVWYYHCPSW